MKKNSKNIIKSRYNDSTTQIIKPKKIYKSKDIVLRTNQISLAGKHSILSAIRNRGRKLYYLITTEGNYFKWNEEISKLNLKLDIKIKSKEEIDKINNYKPHQNVLLITEALKRLSMDDFLSNAKVNKKIPLRLILLDHVTDPQNVGAIIRSALAFKMDGLALSQRNSPNETASLSKASSGAIEKLKIIKFTNMTREIKKLRKNDFSIYGLANKGEMNIYDLENITGNIALILGSEGKGLRRLTRENVDYLIKIPINEESESLNVSNAASIAMYQLQKNIIKN